MRKILIDSRKKICLLHITLHDLWPSAGAGALYVHFSELLPGAKLTLQLCVPVLRAPIFAALLHGTRAVAVSGTRSNSLVLFVFFLAYTQRSEIGFCYTSTHAVTLIQDTKSTQKFLSAHHSTTLPLALFCAVTLYIHFAIRKIHFLSKSCVLLCWQRYCTALEQCASAKFCGVRQGMELPNYRSAFVPCIFHGAAITLGIVISQAIHADYSTGRVYRGRQSYIIYR